MQQEIPSLSSEWGQLAAEERKRACSLQQQISVPDIKACVFVPNQAAKREI